MSNKKQALHYPLNLMACIFPDSYDADVLQERVEDALDTLSAREREIILDRYERGKTYKEIGKAFSISESRAKGIESRAIYQLRRPTRRKIITLGQSDNEAFYDTKVYAKQTEEENTILRHELVRVQKRLREMEEKMALLAPYGDEVTLTVTPSASIRELGLRERSLNILIEHTRVRTVSDLARFYRSKGSHGITTLPGAGLATVKDIENCLAKTGYEFFINAPGDSRMQVPECDFPASLLQQAQPDRLEVLGLSVRAYNVVRRVGGINTVQELIDFYKEKGDEGFFRLRGAGVGTVAEIKSALEKHSKKLENAREYSDEREKQPS